MHAAGNLLNTLFDFRNGYDSPGSSDLTLVNKVLLPVLEAVSRGEQVAVIGSDFHGGSAVIAVEPC